MIQWYDSRPGVISVPPTAATIATTPETMPRRAVLGWLIHFSERMKRAVETR